MTLTLDEVRKTRFHMARRNGYEVLEVDSFVDKIEATLASMEEQNDTLKRQVESLSKGGAQAPAAAPAGGDRREVESLKAELEAARREAEQAKRDAQQARQAAPAQSAPQPAPAVDNGELTKLRRENEELRTKLAQAQQHAAQQQAAPAVHQQQGTTERIVVTTSDQASPAVVRLVQLATAQAEQVVREANDDAKRTIDDANKKAHEITVDATTRAERTESEARVNADKVTADAQVRAKNLDKETADKRTELFAALEKERDELKGNVTQLRGFEADYRNNLTKHLQAQIEAVKAGKFEPGTKPSLLGQGTGGVAESKPNSNTPRLDALLGDSDKH